MSGHSKWSTIKRQKGKTDAKRGLTFTKLSNAITIAVKQGGGVTDPNSNFKLRLAMDSARSLNMPKENIDRAIARAAKKDIGDLEEVIYEGFAPGGVSLIIEAVTDNSMRTTAEVKSQFNKAGASFGQQGSVSYQFSQIGEIEVEKSGKTFDEIFSVAAENGAEDVEDLGDTVLVYTDTSSLAKVKNSLSDLGFNILSASLSRKPNITVEVGDSEQLGKILKFIEAIDSMDDVQNVYSNLKQV